MKEKSPVDRIRESGGSIEIGTDADGAIMESLSMGDYLILIKERAIYQLDMADTVDPNRTNIGLPRMIPKLIIDKGTESPFVNKILLTAKSIFSPNFYNEGYDHKRMIHLSLELLSEYALLIDEISDYKDQENKAADAYEKRKIEKSQFELPAILNLDSKCKTIFQKADHIEQTLMEVIIQFYPNQGLTKQSHFPNFHAVLKRIYGEEDPFSGYIQKTVYFMKVVRELRNGLDHRLQMVKVVNFELQTDGSIISPTIALKHKEVEINRCSLSEFLMLVQDNLLSIIETTFAYLAAKNVKKGGMPYQLREIPIERRRNQDVIYSFWMPLGPEGYYCQ
jgi:hypothetical protein